MWGFNPEIPQHLSNASRRLIGRLLTSAGTAGPPAERWVCKGKCCGICFVVGAVGVVGALCARHEPRPNLKPLIPTLNWPRALSETILVGFGSTSLGKEGKPKCVCVCVRD